MNDEACLKTWKTYQSAWGPIAEAERRKLLARASRTTLRSAAGQLLSRLGLQFDKLSLKDKILKFIVHYCLHSRHSSACSARWRPLTSR